MTGKRHFRVNVLLTSIRLNVWFGSGVANAFLGLKVRYRLRHCMNIKCFSTVLWERRKDLDKVLELLTQLTR